MNIRINGYGKLTISETVFRDWRGKERIQIAYTQQVAWIEWLVFQMKDTYLCIPVSEEIAYDYARQKYALREVWGKFEQVYLYDEKKRGYIRILRQEGAEDLWDNLKTVLQRIETEWMESEEAKRISEKG